MVKLSRGGKNNMHGRQKPRPLFPPGELPVFGPPSVYMRRPPGPPPTMGPMGYGPPPPPPMRPPPHHMGPPMPPPPPMRHRPRPVLPPPGPPMPLLQAPIMPPRPLPFMRGGGRMKPPMGRMGMGMGMGKRLGKPMKKAKNKKGKNKPVNKVNDEHYCESCDSGWETAEELENHLTEHVNCEYENCTFTAHPKKIEVHVKLQHLTGLFDRIKFSYSKEEIEKWREERKKHYPTKQIIEEKRAAALEKEERGERMDNNNSRINKKNNQKEKQNMVDHEVGPLKTNRRRKRHRRTVYIPNDKVPSQRDIVMEEVKHVIRNLIIDEDPHINDETTEISDTEWNYEAEAGQSSTPETHPKVCNVLAALSAAYNSDSEDETDEVDLLKKQVNKVIETDKGTSLMNDESPEEQTSKVDVDTLNIEIKEDTSNKDDKKENLVRADKSLQKGHKRNLNRKETKIQYKKFRKPTLLEQLLANEIRQERNHILQCIRFIINNNFFDENSEQTSTPKNGSEITTIACENFN